MNSSRKTLALLTGSAILVFVAMVASFAPTPLYPLYKQIWGLTDPQIAWIFTSYPVGVLIVLIFLGGISDRIGRRTTLFVGIGILAVAFVSLAFAPTYPFLLLGRLLHGFGIGMVTSAAASAIMESHPKGIHAGAFLNTACIALGIAFGPLLSGVLTDLLPFPLITPYLVIALSLAVPLVFLMFATNDQKSISQTRIIRPIAVPRKLLLPFSVSSATIACANLAMSLFGSFGGEISSGIGWSSQTQIGWFIFMVFFMLAIAQFVGRRWHFSVMVAAGAVGSTIGWGLTLWGVTAEVTSLFVLGSLIVGFSSGLCLLGSGGLIAAISPEDRRAELYSAHLVVAFTTLGLVAIVAGPLIANFGILFVQVLAAFGSLMLALWVVSQGWRLRKYW